MVYDERKENFIAKEDLKRGAYSDPDRVSPYRLKKGPEKVQKILSSFLLRHGLENKINQYQFITHWKDIVGEGIAKNATPSSLKNKVLYVKVSSSSWVQELSFQKQTILNRLNDFLNEENKVMDIRFTL